MSNVKTAISLNEALFEEAEALAREMKTSRSGLVALALTEFIERRRNRRLLEAIDDAFRDAPDRSEEVLRRHMRRGQRRLLAGEW